MSFMTGLVDYLMDDYLLQLLLVSTLSFWDYKPNLY